MLKLEKTNLHSGKISKFKIECDALTDEDIECFAALGSHIAGRFSRVYGVPAGGEKLAKAMEKYTDEFSPYTLVVDDVTTTGGSMESFIASDIPAHPFYSGSLKCLTIFNRGGVSSIQGSSHHLLSIFDIDSRLRNI